MLVNSNPESLHAPAHGTRFCPQMTVLRVKEKLLTHCGSNISTMSLVLKDWDGKVVGHLTDDTRALGYYTPLDGCVWLGKTVNALHK